jgi:hypothetical protein
MAAGHLGAYAVPINWHFTSEEAGYILADSRAKVLVIHADLLAQIASGIPVDMKVLVVPTPPEIGDAYGVAAERRSAPGAETWDESVAASTANPEPPKLSRGSMMRQIEQRVDQQGLLAVRNQTGITPAPRSRQAANKRSSRVRDRAVPWCIAICSCKVRNAALSAFDRLVYCSRLGAGCVAGPGVVTPKKGPNPTCPGRLHEPTSPSSARSLRRAS